MSSLSSRGKTLLVANPAAQNGAGAQAAEHAATLLRAALGEEALDVLLTEAPGHAEQVAANSGSYAAVVALGGDGIVHETANGLLHLSAADRPVLGVIPVGSGNDYACTLGMCSQSVEKAVSQLLVAQSRQFDVGCCNGRYFVETLSFGLDAAIALDTVERRKRTGKTGTMLYLESGIDQLLHHLDKRRYRAQAKGWKALDYRGCRTGAGKAERNAATFSVDAPVALEGESYLFAVQLGQTYGGGFRVCPDARTDDGLFDICVAHPPLSPLYAVLVFLLAKDAHHTRFKQLEFFRARSLRLSFDAPLSVQMDGERFEASEYDITCIPGALNVLIP